MDINGKITDNSGCGVKIMGIVNITPDSFYSDSRNMDADGNVLTDKAVKRVVDMVKQGAGYIDIGACSTRPGSESVDAEHEWKKAQGRAEADTRGRASGCKNLYRHVPMGHNIQNTRRDRRGDGQ